MSNETIIVLRGDKCADVIMSISKLYDCSLQKAADLYYSSETAGLIEDGVADLQCRSSKYLATLVWEEH